MQRIILHGAEMKTPDMVHDILKERLELPDYYGANLDALWDCLTGWIDLPIVLEWTDYETSRRHLGAFADELRETFQHAADELEGFTFQLT